MYYNPYSNNQVLREINFKKVGQIVRFEREDWKILNKTTKQIQLKNIRNGKTKHVPVNTRED